MPRLTALGLIFLMLMLLAPGDAAYAHAPHGYGGGFIAGFTHPIVGWDMSRPWSRWVFGARF